jgi:hypothetical protein
MPFSGTPEPFPVVELWSDADFRAVIKPIGVDVELTFAGQVIHRLDTPVSGVLLLGKTSRALEAGSALFANRGVHKVYWALVAKPLPSGSGRLRHWLEHRQKGNKTFAHKQAAKGRLDSWLDYQLLAQGDRYTLYEIVLGTGRTHQIRAQLAAAGSPVKAHAAHPGYSATNLQGNTEDRFGTSLWNAGNRLVATSAEFGAAPTLYASSADLPPDSFIGPKFGARGPVAAVGRSPLARDAKTARALWTLSEQLTGIEFPL